MAYIRSVVTFQGVSGLAEDRFQNVWHFVSNTAPVNSDFASIGATLDLFYCGDSGVSQTNTLMSYMARDRIISSPKPYVTHSVIEAGGGTGSPDAVSDLLGWAAGAATTDLPNEVAMCLSFHSDLDDIPEEVGLTRPASRRRGRVYLGPLNTTALDANGRPASVFLDDIVYAANALRTSAELAGKGIAWAVYSRTDDQARVVTGGHVDNAFDTQRRRGVDSTLRGVFP